MNRFRDMIIAVLQSGSGDEALICSGFFQESRGSDPYQASQEANLAGVLMGSRVSLVTVGVHHGSWVPSYRNFWRNLQTAGVNVRACSVTNLHWHAKVFILKRQGRPIFGIIGSSNITRPAFSTTRPFNYEADVYLWEDDVCEIATAIGDQISAITDSDEIIKAPYNAGYNGDLTVEDRLRKLEAEIFARPYRELH